jgi:hypothetical protein
MNKFSKHVEDILKSEIGLVKESVRKIAREVAEQSCKELESTAPHRNGKYRKSFKVDDTDSMTAVVHSEKHYRLTHLLEFGHDVIKNGKRVGRAKAYPHWARVEENGIKEFEKKIQKEIENG